MFDQDKTEDATPRKRQRAREQGQSALSHDLVTALVFLCALGLLGYYGKKLAAGLLDWSRQLWEEGAWLSTDTDSMTAFLSSSLQMFLLAVLVPVILLFIVTIGAHLVQVGWFFLPEKILPKFERLNPKTALSRIFSLEGVMRTGNNLVKMIACLTACALMIWRYWDTLLLLGQSEPSEIFVIMCGFLMKTAFAAAIALLVVAAGDFGWQRWKFEREMKMTPQEVREELKETMGDPLVIGRRRQIQESIAKR